MKQCKGVCTIILFAIQILDATSISNRTQDIPDVLSEGEQSKELLFWEVDIPTPSSLLPEIKQWQRYWKNVNDLPTDLT